MVDDATGTYSQTIDITSYVPGNANEVGVGEQATLNFDEVGLSLSINNGIGTILTAAAGGTDWGANAASTEASVVSMDADQWSAF